MTLSPILKLYLLPAKKNNNNDMLNHLFKEKRLKNADTTYNLFVSVPAGFRIKYCKEIRKTKKKQ